MSIGLGNIASIMKNAKKIQQMVQDAQSEFEKLEVSGSAGADMVKVTMNGKHYISKVEIDEEAAKENKEVLEELIAAAVNDAVRKVEAETQNKMADAKQLMGVFDEEQN